MARGQGAPEEEEASYLAAAPAWGLWATAVLVPPVAAVVASELAEGEEATAVVVAALVPTAV